MVARKILYNLFGRLMVGRSLDLERLAVAVREAEKGHVGEIAVSVATVSPVFFAPSPRERALEAFSKLAVWDTEDNSGVLLFVSLPDHAIEIIADRGAAQRIPQAQWSGICSEMAGMFRRDEDLEKIIEFGIRKIGEELRSAFPGERRDNQLPDGIKVR